jgi:glucosamine--fructose-6-phosphate aminotransferase (isomerizing)
MGKTGLLNDIYNQPESLKRLISNGWAGVVESARRIHSFKPEWIYIAGRGTSDNAARYAKYLFGAYNRLGVALAVPSLFTTYKSPPNISKALTIGISQSGKSENVLAVVKEAKRQGGMTLAITNDPDSPLARACDTCIRLIAKNETATTATKTYANQLMVIAMLSVALEKETNRWDALTSMPEAVQNTLTLEPQYRQMASFFAKAPYFLVVGQGFNYSTANETAFKLGEICGVSAISYSPSELLDGPVAIINKDVPVILINFSGKQSKQMDDFYKIACQRNAKIILLSDNPQLLKETDMSLPVEEGIPEWLSPIAAIIPAQLFAYHLSFAKGIVHG